jgi:hypothetical protein
MSQVTLERPPLRATHPVPSSPRKLAFDVTPTNLRGVLMLRADFDPNTVTLSKVFRNGLLWLLQAPSRRPSYARRGNAYSHRT